uniref:HNH endonuclease n=1 Tax=Pithovirus LCPAC403 TaxID=2506596 RepID=A0A481ZB97_9VIRU|nr:MAG: HNH endonuclease [Pithovirus LCPAC403]
MTIINTQCNDCSSNLQKLCGVETRRGNTCTNKPSNGNLTCSRHTIKVTEPFFDHKEDHCPLCGDLEEWKWASDFGFPNYMISSLGKVFNITTKKYLNGSVTDQDYIGFRLTKHDESHKNIRIHTLQGVVFFGLELLGKDDKVVITMDHIDSNKKEHNCTCCNLRPADRSLQAKNRNPFTPKGKTVLKISEDGETVIRYLTIISAAKDLEIDPRTLIKHCDEGTSIEEHTYRFETKDDYDDQTWKSTSELYPECQPPIEISDGGMFCRINKTPMMGSNIGRYLSISGITGRVHKIVWTVFNNRLVPDGYEISHLNSNGKDNRLVNLCLATHSENVKVTIDSGKHSKCIITRKHFHDGNYIDFISNAAAARSSDDTSESSVRRAAKGEIESAGMCKCGKKLTWEQIMILRSTVETNTEMRENQAKIKRKITNRSWTPVRQVFHDDTHKDYKSINEALRSNSKLSQSGISDVLRGKQKTSGMCKCGKRFKWIKLDRDGLPICVSD